MTHLDISEMNEAWAKYPDTILELHVDPPLRIDLRKQLSPAVLMRLSDLKLSAFSVMTSENPDGEEPEDATSARDARQHEIQNQRSLSALEGALHAEGVAHVATTARSADGTHSELCFSMQLDTRHARRWAERFSQLAYFYFDGERFWLQPGTLEKAPLALPPSAPSAR